MVDEVTEEMKMSNLGGYQRLVVLAKKVGGPRNLVCLIVGTGAVLYKTGEIVVKQTVKSIKKKTSKERFPESANTNFYTVTAEYTSNEGLEFKIGDQFRVLESDKDAVLIEKKGDDNNPYFVSSELLQKISDYKCRR